MNTKPFRAPTREELLEAIRYCRETKENGWRNAVSKLCRELDKLDDPFGEAVKEVSRTGDALPKSRSRKGVSPPLRDDHD
jgi:hypothetical protein